MPSGHCTICLTHYPIDQFQAFLCGHCFCTQCTSDLFKQSSKKCPHCRVPVRRGEFHPIFLELVDTPQAFASSVIEGLTQMGPSTPSGSIRKASQKLSKMLQGTQPEGTMTMLLKAVDDFRERIIPLFAKVETQTLQIVSLKDDLRRCRRDRESLQSKMSKMEPLQFEVSRLQHEVDESETNLREAIRLAEAAKDEAGKQNENTTYWTKKAAELDQENKRFKDMLERHRNDAQVQKEKGKKLKRQIADLTQKLADKEKETMSDGTQDYDGDFSSHEHSSSMRIVATPSRQSSRYPYHDENRLSLDFEGMPGGPRFPSDWHIGNPSRPLKKRVLNEGTLRKVANPFPIELDVKGHPTRAVQLGPKSIVHVGR